jgi:hypothetical protein
MPESFNLLSSTDFADDYNRQSRGISQIAVFNRHLPFIIPLFMRVPRKVLAAMSSEGAVMAFDFQTVSFNFIAKNDGLTMLQDLARQAASVVRPEKRNDNSVLEGM